MQFVADVLGVEVVRPTVSETTALGAAYLAGLSVGLWPGVETLAERWREERRFLPRIAAAERARLRRGWERAIERAKGWAQE
jgi:glycerol kinase